MKSTQTAVDRFPTIFDHLGQYTINTSRLAPFQSCSSSAATDAVNSDALAAHPIDLPAQAHSITSPGAAVAIDKEILAPTSYRKSVVVPMPGPSDAFSKPRASTSNVYAQKVVVKQAGRSHMADPLQDMQKQRLLQPDSPRKSDSPASHVPQRPNQLQPLVNYSPRQNGTANGQQSVARPHSASFAESLGSESQPQSQSASQAPDALPRPRTATASVSPRTTNEQHAFAVIRSKNVSWQDAQGENLCQYREFEPSEAGDSDNDDTDWHTQKKGCCTIM
ncbi:hypothetical protein WJX77_009245 [Trebouxia sp. C0004]